MCRQRQSALRESDERGGVITAACELCRSHERRDEGRRVCGLPVLHRLRTGGSTSHAPEPGALTSGRFKFNLKRCVCLPTASGSCCESAVRKGDFSAYVAFGFPGRCVSEQSRLQVDGELFRNLETLARLIDSASDVSGDIILERVLSVQDEMTRLINTANVGHTITQSLCV